MGRAMLKLIVYFCGFLQSQCLPDSMGIKQTGQGRQSPLEGPKQLRKTINPEPKSLNPKTLNATQGAHREPVMLKAPAVPASCRRELLHVFFLDRGEVLLSNTREAESKKMGTPGPNHSTKTFGYIIMV